MMKKLIFTLGAILLANAFVSAQNKELQDGKSLIEAYVSPLAYGLGTALNNGWYNTAKPHHFGGFDVTLTANLLLVPTEAKTFNISDGSPVCRAEFYQYIADQLEVGRIPDEAGSLQKGMANKRVCSQKFLEHTGLSLAYPDFRKGIDQSLHS